MPSTLTLPNGYRIERSRDGYALHSDYFGEIGEGDYGCWASACAAAIDHEERITDEAASALVDAELDRLYDIVNAQGGICSRTDAAGLARLEAVSIVLAAIDSISAPSASQKAA